MLKSKRTEIIKAGVNMYDGEGDSWSNERYNDTPDNKNDLTKQVGGGLVPGAGTKQKKHKSSPYG